MRRLADVGKPLAPGYFYAVDPLLILMLTLAILTALSLAVFAVPLALVAPGDRPPLVQLAYFGAIGFGFMILEIVLIQRFVLFLGFPTYALSVVLFSLLIFTGLGSLLSTRYGEPRRALGLALGGLCVLIAASILGLQSLLSALIQLPLFARMMASVVILAPFGLTMGAAMPIGLRRLGGLHPTGVAYAWGVNGVASVVASVMAVAAAITFGFGAATLIAGLCYAGALIDVLAGEWPGKHRSQITG